jgi:hypothetical protein
MEITIKIYEDNTACTVSVEDDVTAVGLVELFLQCAMGAGFVQTSIVRAMREIDYIL